MYNPERHSIEIEQRTAIVLQPQDAHGEPAAEPRLYLVAETKASLARAQLRPAEAGKI